MALNGLENILRLGEQDVKTSGAANPYAVIIEEVFGLDKIEFLQSHENMEIYQKAFDIIERYFGTEEEDKDVSISANKSDKQILTNNSRETNPDNKYCRSHRHRMPTPTSSASRRAASRSRRGSSSSGDSAPRAAGVATENLQRKRIDLETSSRVLT